MNRDDWRARHDDPRTLAAYNMITVEQARLEGIEDALRAEGCRGKWLPVFLQGTVTRRNRDAVLALAEAQAPAWRRLGEVLGEVAARRTGRPVEVRIRPYAPGEGGPGAHEMGWGAMREDGAVHLDGKLLDGPCPPRRGIGRWRTRMALVLAVLEHECGHVLHDPRWLTRPRVVVGPWWDKVAEYYLREGRMERARRWPQAWRGGGNGCAWPSPGWRCRRWAAGRRPSPRGSTWCAWWAGSPPA